MLEKKNFIICCLIQSYCCRYVNELEYLSSVAVQKYLDYVYPVGCNKLFIFKERGNLDDVDCRSILVLISRKLTFFNVIAELFKRISALYDFIINLYRYYVIISNFLVLFLFIYLLEFPLLSQYYATSLVPLKF